MGVSSKRLRGDEALAPSHVHRQRQEDASFCTSAATATTLGRMTCYPEDPEACLPPKTPQCRKPLPPPESSFILAPPPNSTSTSSSRINAVCSTFRNSIRYYYAGETFPRARPGGIGHNEGARWDARSEFNSLDIPGARAAGRLYYHESCDSGEVSDRSELRYLVGRPPVLRSVVHPTSPTTIVSAKLTWAEHQ